MGATSYTLPVCEQASRIKPSSVVFAHSSVIIFALFGAPVAHEDHPQRALYAALRMQDELKRYSARLRGAGNMPIEGRVGVNAAEVVVSSIPESARRLTWHHEAFIAGELQSRILT